MYTYAGRLSFYAAGLTAILAAALAGCATHSGSTSSGTGSTSSSSGSSGNALGAVQLAAQTAKGANSYTGTMSLQVTAKSGTSGSTATSMTASFAEQLHPSVLAEVQVGTLSSGGTSLPGGLTEIITPSALYMKWSFLTQELHMTKPWLAIPLSSMNNSGVDLSQIFSEAESSGPLTQSSMLAGATNVHEVGTGVVGGVPVTEYTGTLSLAKAIEGLSGSTKTAVQKEIATAGLSTAQFTVWIDGQHVVRKSVIVEDGSTVNETITTTLTSINQPVNVQIPPASETTSLSGSELGGLGGSSS